MPRRKGFTLIELLVVIAIIGILAAMLFPVFARARESARKTQCLANVKNLSIAMNMYLTDYDRTPPEEHRAEVLDYFDGHPGGNDNQWKNADTPLPCGRDHINPYLRYAVIMDDYTKNRDIWKCPSAKITSSPEAIIAGDNWFQTVQDGIAANVFGYEDPVCLKDNSFPPGWGGAVTDSLKQAMPAGGGGVWGATNGGDSMFTIGLTMNAAREVSTSQMDDAAKYVVVNDGGIWMEVESAGMVAYPDLCEPECGNCMGWADWVNCSDWAADCGLYSIAPKDGSLLRDRNALKAYARHLGGSNIGFMDGHAKWYPAESFLAAHKEGGDGSMGLWTWGPTSFNWASTCGFPTTEPLLY